MITQPVYKGLRKALCDANGIAILLDQYKGEPAVFTRRPVPEEVEGVLAIINPPIALSNEDLLISDRPVWNGTIAFYGPKGTPGSGQDKTREVEQAADLTRELFHRQRFSVQVEGFSVIDVVAGGPVPGPTDDDNEVARIVSLRIRLRRV